MTASFRGGGDDSARKSRGGMMSKFQSFVNSKVFSGKQKQRFVQNILEINLLWMDNPNATDRPRTGGIFSTRKKGDKGQSKHIASNKFYILYKSRDHPEFYSSGNK
jgi:hypothetical protein